jgi:hypothetical protein
VAEFIFWMCLLLPVYAYLGYPLLLTLAPLFPAWRHTPAPPLNVSIVIAAHNEARHIEHKLRTLLAQDYQPASCRSFSPATVRLTTPWPARTRLSIRASPCSTCRARAKPLR